MTIPDDSGWDGRIIREPEPVPPEVEAEIRAHVKAALRRVGWPPEPVDDYETERASA